MTLLERLLYKKADLETLLKEANQIVNQATEQTRELGWSELEARIHVLEATLILIDAELSRHHFAARE